MGAGLLSALGSLLLTASTEATIIYFDLLGKGGEGLLSSNHNGVVTNGGSGGEMGQGIYLDTDDNRLYVLVEWGSERGYTDLSGPATAQHLHGPTPSSGPAAYLEEADIVFPLIELAFIVNPSATGGSINGSAPLTDTQVSELLAGRYYIDIHTGENPAGELRGHLVPAQVPEPAASVLVMAGLSVTGWRRRRRQV